MAGCGATRSNTTMINSGLPAVLIMVLLDLCQLQQRLTFPRRWATPAEWSTISRILMGRPPRQPETARDLSPVVVVGIPPPSVQRALLPADRPILDGDQGHQASRHGQAAEQHRPTSPDGGLPRVHRVAGIPVRPVGQQVVGRRPDCPSVWRSPVVAGHGPQQHRSTSAQRDHADQVCWSRSTGGPPVALTPARQREGSSHQERRKGHCLERQIRCLGNAAPQWPFAQPHPCPTGRSSRVSSWLR